MMKPKEIFNLAVRLLGLLFLYHAVQALPLGIGRVIAALPQHPQLHGSFSGFISGVFMIAWPLLVGIWLLRHGAILTEMAYPGAPARTKDQTEIGGSV